jgi:hypothetical protein
LIFALIAMMKQSLPLSSSKLKSSPSKTWVV